MGGCRCSFRNCKSATKNSDNIHFFHYPVKNPARCKQWIENARKPDFFDLPEDQLRNKVVCELHFEQRCFSNSTRKRLIHDAVPTLDIGCEEEASQSNGEYNHIFGDVQILPASTDGTIFTVDTEGMQQLCESEEIETYIYRNGVLTPMYKSDTKFFYESSNDNIVFAVADNIHDCNSTSSNVPPSTQQDLSSSMPDNQQILNSSSQENFPVLKRNDLKRSYNSNTQVAKYSKISTDNNSNVESQDVICTEIEIDTTEVETLNSYNLQSPQEVNAIIKPPVAIEQSTVQKEPPQKRKSVTQKRIIQKLNYHTRELNSIKQLLKVNPYIHLNKKQRQKFALQTLKSYIPSTLYEVVTRTLKDSFRFSKDKNKDFFKSLFTMSPKAYQWLQEQWGLPVHSQDIDTKTLQKHKSIQTVASEGQCVKSVQTFDFDISLLKGLPNNQDLNNQSGLQQNTIGTQCFIDVPSEQNSEERSIKGIQCLMEQAAVQQNTVGTQYFSSSVNDSDSILQNTVGTQCFFDNFQNQNEANKDSVVSKNFEFSNKAEILTVDNFINNKNKQCIMFKVNDQTVEDIHSGNEPPNESVVTLQVEENINMES